MDGSFIPLKSEYAMKARRRKGLRKLSSEKKSNKLKLTPGGKKDSTLRNLPKCLEVTYNSQPPLRSKFKSASFSSSCRINYDFKVEMSPFTKWVADKSSRV